MLGALDGIFVGIEVGELEGAALGHTPHRPGQASANPPNEQSLSDEALQNNSSAFP